MYGNVRVARLLVDAGAGRDEANQFGTTPLSVAQRYGHNEIARFLKEGGLEPKATKARNV